MNWYEKVKQDFIKNISDSYTLNLAMSVLEDRKTSLDENLKLQNNWNKLKNSLKDELNTIKNTCSQVNGNYFMMNDKIEWLEEKLEQIRELEQGKDE